MRKRIQRIMVFCMCMLLLTISPINAFASTATVEEEAASELFAADSARSSFTMSIEVG